MTGSIQEHYLDHAATTPMAPGVADAWLDAATRLSARPGNPASLHAGGRAARQILENARQRIADVLGADRAEVIFTSGATESDALGVVGCARGVKGRYPQRHRVLISGVEHDAVLEQGAVLADAGLSLEELPVDRDGVTQLTALEDPVNWADVAVVSLVHTASEVGTVQPLAQLRELAVTAVDAVSVVETGRTLLHTDAAQALSVEPINFHDSGFDAITIGGHKVGGPVGTGVLLLKRGTPHVSDRPGGGHERGIRSGTPDAAGAVALATAIEYVTENQAQTSAHLKELREYLLRGLSQVCDGQVVASLNPQLSSPAIIHLSLPTRHPEALLLAMDAAGVHLSAGSACHAGVTRPSAVMLRMGRTEDEALGVLRVSTGRETTTKDIDAFLATLPVALEAAKALDALEARR